MATLEKLIQKIFAGGQISYQDAEKMLLILGYRLKISSSHHIFRKLGYDPLSIKKRHQLLAYQVKELQEVLIEHGYTQKQL